HGTGVHTRAAANAFERAPESLAAQLRTAAVVHQHEMQRLPGSWSMDVRGVDGGPLPRAAAREESQKHRELRRARDHLLDPHGRNVNRRERGAEVGVAL